MWRCLDPDLGESHITPAVLRPELPSIMRRDPDGAGNGPRLGPMQTAVLYPCLYMGPISQVKVETGGPAAPPRPNRGWS